MTKLECKDNAVQLGHVSSHLLLEANLICSLTTDSLVKEHKDNEMKIFEMEQAALKAVLDVTHLEQILENSHRRGYMFV